MKHFMVYISISVFLRNYIFLTLVQGQDGPNFGFLTFMYFVKIFSTKYFVRILRNFVNYWKKLRGFFPKLKVIKNRNIFMKTPFLPKCPGL